MSGSGEPLPFAGVIQRAFGRHDIGRLTAHTDAGAAASARALGANAYTIGSHIAFAGPPSLRTSAHEAAHAIQQRAGVQLESGIDRPGDAYERHADAVAERVVAGRSAEALLDGGPSGTPPACPACRAVAAVQRKCRACADEEPRSRVVQREPAKGPLPGVGEQCRIRKDATRLVMHARVLALPERSLIEVTRKPIHDHGMIWIWLVVRESSDKAVLGLEGAIQSHSLIECAPPAERGATPTAKPAATASPLEQRLAELKSLSTREIVGELAPTLTRLARDPADAAKAQHLISAIKRVLGDETMLAVLDAVTTALEQPAPDPAALLRVPLGNSRQVGLFPHVAAPVSVVGAKLLGVSDAFLTGFSKGVQTSAAGVDWPLLAGKLAAASVVNALTANTLVTSGMVAGFVKDIYDTIKALFDLPTMLKQIVELFGALLEDNGVATQLGEAAGAALGGAIAKAAGYSPPRLAFHIGYLVGPLVVGALLSLVGVGEVIGALKSVPAIAKVLETVKAGALRAGALVGKIGRAVKAVALRIGGELHHLVVSQFGLRMCSPPPCLLLLHRLEQAVGAATSSPAKSQLAKLLAEVKAINTKLGATRGVPDADTAQAIEAIGKRLESLAAADPQIKDALTRGSLRAARADAAAVAKGPTPSAPAAAPKPVQPVQPEAGARGIRDEMKSIAAAARPKIDVPLLAPTEYGPFDRLIKLAKAKSPFSSSQKTLNREAVNYYLQAMKQFPEYRPRIPVFNGQIVDGHHRYIASLIAGRDVEIVPLTKLPATIVDPVKFVAEAQPLQRKVFEVFSEAPKFVGVE